MSETRADTPLDGWVGVVDEAAERQALLLSPKGRALMQRLLSRLAKPLGHSLGMEVTIAMDGVLAPGKRLAPADSMQPFAVLNDMLQLQLPFPAAAAREALSILSQSEEMVRHLQIVPYPTGGARSTVLVVPADQLAIALRFRLGARSVPGTALCDAGLTRRLLFSIRRAAVPFSRGANFASWQFPLRLSCKLSLCSLQDISSISEGRELRFDAFGKKMRWSLQAGGGGSACFALKKTDSPGLQFSIEGETE